MAAIERKLYQASLVWRSELIWFMRAAYPEWYLIRSLARVLCEASVFGFRAILHLFSWVLSRHAAALHTHPICIGLLFVFYTRENNCMHPIYFLCKLLSVGFQHCLTIAYSKAV